MVYLFIIYLMLASVANFNHIHNMFKDNKLNHDIEQDDSLLMS